MKNSAYICNATNPNTDNIHTKNTAKYSVSSCVLSVIRWGFVAKLIRGIRSFFVHTRKTCYTMLQTNKQATKANNSNLSAIDILVVLGTLCIGTLFLIFAPEILVAFGKFLACLALVAMAVVPAIYSLTYKPYEDR